MPSLRDFLIFAIGLALLFAAFAWDYERSRDLRPDCTTDSDCQAKHGGDGY